MRADNSAFIVQSARNRRAATLSRAHDALRRLDRAGATINFKTVADTAGVSRAWLYREPTIRAEIERHRPPTPRAETARFQPAAQRASSDSLQRRLEAAHAEITRLRHDNSQLREQIAALHGELRATKTRR